MKTMRLMVGTVLAPLVQRHVYTQRTGLAAGLKRRGGFGFLPFHKTLTQDSQEQRFLEKQEFAGQTVYDVGAHVGLLTLFFARAVGETGNVIAFEPNPQNYRTIIDHVYLNRLTNVKVIPLGLSSRSGSLRFVVTRSALGTAEPHLQMQYEQEKGVRVFQIEVDTLDGQVGAKGLPAPDFIKIDVEGLELDVLRGMVETIHAHRPRILLELHGPFDREVVAFLLAAGYRVHQVERPIAITRQNIDSVYGHLYADPG